MGRERGNPMNGETIVTAKQIEELKEFFNKRRNDESKKNDTFNAGAIAGLYMAAMILGIDIDDEEPRKEG